MRYSLLKKMGLEGAQTMKPALAGKRVAQRIFLLPALLLVFSAHAQSPCEAWYKFDGNLSDASGNGYDGAMFNREGGPALPSFSAGLEGGALHLDGTAGMRAYLDLHPDQCPQVTIAAWIRVESLDVNSPQYLVSTGPGGGPGVYATGRTIVLRGAANGLWHRSALRDPRGWFFVAGVYDYEAGTYRLHFRNRTWEGSLGDNPRPPEDALWVGVLGDGFDYPARDVHIDELRVVGRALGVDDIGRLAARVVSQPWLTAVPHAMAGRTSSAGEPREASGTSLPPPGPQPLVPGTAAPAAGSVLLDPPEGPNAVGTTNPDLAMPEDLPGGTPLATPGDASPDQQLLDAGPAGQTDRDPGLTAAEDLPAGPVVPDTPPVSEPIHEIICEGTLSRQPTIMRAGQFPAGFVAALEKARDCGLRIKVASLNDAGQWIVATPDQIAHSHNLPPALAARLRQIESRHGGLDAADVAENGAWVLFADGEFAQDGLNTSTETRVRSAAESGSRVVSFDFHPTSNDRWALVTDAGAVFGDGLPPGISRALPDRSLTQRTVYQVKLTSDGWLMLGSDYWFTSENIDAVTLRILHRHQETGRRPDHVVLGAASDQFTIYSAAPETSRSGDPLYQIEHFTGGATIWNRMVEYNLKAVSIAMVRNNEIAWARAYGLKNADDLESYVDERTTFDAASISKPIAAFGLLQLVQDGKLSLTEEGVLEDIEDLFNSDEVTRYRDALNPAEGNLIQLLQHCIAVCYDGWSDCTEPDGNGGGAAEYDLGRSIPTTAEMILGTNRGKASHSLVRSEDFGDSSSYTSANFMLVQALIDVHGDGFLNYMETMLRDLGMDRATYMSPYPQRDSGNFGRGWDGNAVTPMVGYGEFAAASLVARPIDVARFVIAVNEVAEDPAAAAPLSNALVQQYLGRDNSIYSSTDYPVCADPSFGGQTWGLGVRRATGWGGNEVYGHGGIHNGYRTRMVGIPGKQSGIVVFMTGDERLSDGDPETTDPLKANLFFNELRDIIVSNYPL